MLLLAPALVTAAAETVPASVVAADALNEHTMLPPEGITAGSGLGHCAATAAVLPDSVTDTAFAVTGAVLGFATVTCPVTRLADVESVRIAATVYWICR